MVIYAQWAVFPIKEFAEAKVHKMQYSLFSATAAVRHFLRTQYGIQENRG